MNCIINRGKSPKFQKFQAGIFSAFILSQIVLLFQKIKKQTEGF